MPLGGSAPPRWPHASLDKCRRALLMLQARARGLAARHTLLALRRHWAARVCQAAWRGWRARRTFQRLRAAAIVLQKYARRRAAVQQLKVCLVVGFLFVFFLFLSLSGVLSGPRNLFLAWLSRPGPSTLSCDLVLPFLRVYR